jgi:hypothetical protein
MMLEINTVRSVQGSDKTLTALPESMLRRAADCAYQVGVACLEGFGRQRDDQAPLELMQTAAEWGSSVARTELLPLSVSLDGNELAGDHVSVQWAIGVIPSQGHPAIFSALWEVNQEICAATTERHSAKRSEAVQAAFK